MEFETLKNQGAISGMNEERKRTVISAKNKLFDGHPIELFALKYFKQRLKNIFESISIRIKA